MGKRNKPTKQNPPVQSGGKSSIAAREVAAPTKQPTLLAVSVILFALWFVFLLITATIG
jgi:hypothetical protein